MKYDVDSPQAYIDALPEDRKAPMRKLRQTILDNLPKSFEETISYGMIGYVVPHTIYPNGYHCNPELPLPFMSIASQKNYISVYHMGLYGDEPLMTWFTNEYPKYSSRKLDMGKCCVRFKKTDDIPYALIGKLAGKISVADWIKNMKST